MNSLPSRNSDVRVLHVDDEPGFAEMVAAFLEREHDALSVTATTSVADARDHLDSTHVDCIVSDYDMPHTNGIEFLHEVREDYGDIPFILFTGNGSEEIAATAIEAGVDSYLQKQRGTDQYALLAKRILDYVDRHQTKRELATLRQDVNLAVNTSTDSFWVVDFPADEITAIEGLQQFGYEYTEDVDMAWWLDCIHPDDRDRIADRVERARNKDRDVFDEFENDRGFLCSAYRFQRADGSYALVRDRATVLFDDQTPIKIAAALTDTTAYEQATDRFEALATLSTDVITVLDADGVATYESPSLTPILGYEPHELVGENVFEYVHPDDRAAVRETFEEGTECPTGETAYPQFRFKHADGSWVWLESAGRNETSPALDGYVITSRDITENKERQQELLQQKERLEEFAGIVSHDIKNPLTTASGYLELARTEGEPEQFDRVADALARIERLLEDVLYLAREGQQIGSTAPVDVLELASDAWQQVGFETPDAAFVPSTGDPVVVEADDDRLQQLLENLFQNAIDHGGPNVSVRVGALTGEAGFFVEDTGPGIPAGERDAVFEMGYSAANGTGFGLAIVEEIASAHDWEITVVDGEEGGTRFEIRVKSPTTESPAKATR